MLAVAALIGADARVPTMVLQRAPLGRRGSYLPTALNVLQCLGWAIFELIVIATAAGLLCDKLFGFKAVWIWKLLFGVVAAVLALLGPVGFVRRFVRKFAIWAVLASVVYLAWWIVDGANLGRIWIERRAQGIVLARGRHGRRRHGLVGAARRRLHALLARPAQRVLRRRASATSCRRSSSSASARSSCCRAGVDPNRPELILIAIAGGGLAAALALLALTVDETDEAFANVYSAAVSTQNLFPRIPQRALIVGASVLATGGALAIDMRSYQRFLLLLGAVFVPLLGVLVADWLLAGAHYTRRARLRRAGLPPGPHRRLACRLLRVRVAVPAGRSRLLEPLDRPPADAVVPDRRLAAELRGRLPADRCRRDARLVACRRSRSSGTSRATVVDGGPPRIGGAPYYAARAWRVLGTRGDDLHALRTRRAVRLRPPSDRPRTAGRLARGNDDHLVLVPLRGRRRAS